jgi:hypothetical protein
MTEQRMKKGVYVRPATDARWIPFAKATESELRIGDRLIVRRDGSSKLLSKQQLEDNALRLELQERRDRTGSPQYRMMLRGLRRSILREQRLMSHWRRG